MMDTLDTPQTLDTPDLPHPSEAPLVLAAQARAYVPWCATAPDVDRLAEELDDLFARLDCIDGIGAITAPVLGRFGPSDHLSNMAYTARQECGEEPYYEPHYAIDYTWGGYHERGDGAAWERWVEACDAAQAGAERAWRGEMAALLRRCGDALASGQSGERRAA